MVEFRYQALDASGNKLRGRLLAETKQEAVHQLRDLRLTPFDLKESQSKRTSTRAQSIWQLEIHLGAKVKGGDFAIFSRQMSTLIHAGVPLAAALQVLSEQTENKSLARCLKDVTSEVLKGNQFSETMIKHKDIFPIVFINMVRAGEVSGNLDEVFNRMAIFFEKEHVTKEKVKSAMAYPIFVSIMAILVTIFLLVKIVPTFVSMFASFHVELPLPTRIVLGVSHFIVHEWWIVLAIGFMLIVGYQLVIRQTRGRYLRDSLLLKVPVFGQLMTKSMIARFARTMASLLGSGVPIIQCLRLSAEVIDNTVITRAIHNSEQSLSRGQSLSEPFEMSNVFPPLVVHMLKVGENAGNLDFMLEKIADFYEAETESMVDRMKSLLEPFMMLILSTVVGFIITAVLTPMFSLYQQIGNTGS